MLHTDASLGEIKRVMFVFVFIQQCTTIQQYTYIYMQPKKYKQSKRREKAKGEGNSSLGLKTLGV